MIFDAGDWAKLALLFHTPGTPYTTYAGYKPDVAEAPNGDTRVCVECQCERPGHEVGRCNECMSCKIWSDGCEDCDGTGRVPNVAPVTTRYLHVAPKYCPPPWAMAYLARAHYEACRVAEALGVPAAYYPRVADGTLRVLDYDVGGSQPEHTDFDLFTIVLYRSTPLDLERRAPLLASADLAARLDAGDAISPGLHIGELGELVGLGPATPHRVPARPYRQQSIVYFAMPDHAAVLPEPHNMRVGATVGEWLNERLARSRVYK